MQKIAIWHAVRDAFAFVFLHPFRLLRLCGPWLVLIALFWAAWMLLLKRSATSPPVAPLVALAFVLALWIVLFGGLISFWVALHRAVLVEEIRPWFAPLRFGRRGWRFVGLTFVVSILMGLPLVPVMLFAVPLATGYLHGRGDIPLLIEWLSAVNIALTLIVWSYGCRLALVFPAAAADEAGDRITRAWERSRGNALRIYTGSVACALPFVAGDQLARALLLPSLSDVLRAGTTKDLFAAVNRGHQIYDPISAVLFLLGFSVMIAFYSYCYLRLAPLAPAGISPEPQPMPAE
jgi:hypothetical protein